MPRAMPWRTLEQRSEAVLSRLERAGVTDPDLLGDVLDVLLEELPPAQAKNKNAQGKAKPVLSFHSKKNLLDAIEKRLGYLDDLLVDYGYELFGVICETILPERYCDPPDAARATDEPPGSVAKRKILQARADKKRRLWHANDARELPDRLGYQTLPRTSNVVSRPRDNEGGKHTLATRDLPVIDLQAPRPAPDPGPLSLVGCMDDARKGYNPAIHLIGDKGDQEHGGEGKRVLHDHSVRGRC